MKKTEIVFISCKDKITNKFFNCLKIGKIEKESFQDFNFIYHSHNDNNFDFDDFKNGYVTSLTKKEINQITDKKKYKIFFKK